MAIHRVIRRSLATIVATGHVLSFVSPAHAYKPFDHEKEVRDINEFRPRLEKIANVLKRATEGYNRAGPQAFVDELPEFILPQEKKHIMRELKISQRMPRVQMTQGSFQFFDGGLLVNEVPFADFLRGTFRTPERNYQYDYSKDLIHNMERWKAETKAGQNSFLRHLDSLFLPQAHAAISWMWVIIGTVALAVGGPWLYRTFIKKDKHGSLDPALEPANAPVYKAPPTPPAPKETPPADGEADGSNTKNADSGRDKPKDPKGEKPNRANVPKDSLSTLSKDRIFEVFARNTPIRRETLSNTIRLKSNDSSMRPPQRGLTAYKIRTALNIWNGSITS